LATFLINLPPQDMQRRLGEALGVYVDAMRYPRGTENQRAAPRFLPQRLMRALPEQRKLQLPHSSLHPEQQPIVGARRRLWSRDDGPLERAKLAEKRRLRQLRLDPKSIKDWKTRAANVDRLQRRRMTSLEAEFREHPQSRPGKAADYPVLSGRPECLHQDLLLPG